MQLIIGRYQMNTIKSYFLYNMRRIIIHAVTKYFIIILYVICNIKNVIYRIPIKSFFFFFFEEQQ